MDMVESQGDLDMLIDSPKCQRLLSASCPDKFKNEVRVTDVSTSDTTEQTLYKMWETLRLYNINIAHMIRLLKDNQQHQRQIVAQAATDNDLLALTADIAKIQSTLAGTNNGSMAAIVDALTFLTSEVADTQSRLASDEFNATQQLLLAVSGLNKRLETLEHQIQSHQADAQLAVDQIND
mmetsp:Transcript_33569/g.38585  ORF Transcript_33569/g.38585 Transcript_33569/m.38585 type:complete len:180 (+) Transcript_33569:758-1297(+)